MTLIHVALGVGVFTSSLVAGLYGLWRWYRVEPSAWFWRLLRVSQGFVVLTAIDGGVLLVAGREVSGLHLMYGVLPLAIHFIAEQLRIASAETVLAVRGLTSSAELGTLPVPEQRSVVLSIVRREVGVMAAAALVTVVLAARAAGWV